MERVASILLVVSVLLAPVTSFGAEVKAFKYSRSAYSDEKGGALRMPEGIACADKQTFVVADTGNGRLIRYSVQEDKLVPGPDIKLAELPYPARLQLNSKGEIYALDQKLLRIAKVSREGAFAGYLEPQGVPAPEKLVPRSFKLDAKDFIYVLDLAGSRVLVLDPAGKFQRQLPLPKTDGFFSDLAVVGGDIYLLNSADPAVFLAAKGGNTFTLLTRGLKEFAAFPTYLTSDNKGLLYLVDQNGDAIVTLGYDGSVVARRLVMGWKDGQLNYPAQVCLADGGQILIADRNNSRVQIFEIQR